MTAAADRRRPASSALADRRRSLRGARRSVRGRLPGAAERWLAAVVKRTFYVLSFDLLARDLTRPLPRSGLHHHDLELRRIARDEPPWWEGRLDPKQLARVRSACADGDIACVALLDGRVVGETWATRVTKGDVRVRLAPDEAYSYGLVTDERYRSNGTAFALMSGLLGALACDGVRRVYGYADRRNRASQVLLRTLLGFEQVQQARRTRIFRRWGFVIPGSARPPAGPLVTSGRRPGPVARPSSGPLSG